MKKLFGTDGIRGEANRFPMTPEVALALGQAIAFHFVKAQGGGRIVIGKDTRRSSYMFEYALSAGISSMGSQAILTGPLPTPGIAYLTKSMRADAGVVISASHNRYSDNGIKFFDRHGYKLPDEVEILMEEFVFSSHEDKVRPMGADIGRAIRIEDAVGRYTEYLKTTFPKDLNLKGLKIVVDCAHGAAYQVAPLVLREMEAEVVALHDAPNGTNINLDCGALYPQKMVEEVLKTGAHVGIALDGDADRVILCDERGQIIDGDKILALCALEGKNSGWLKSNTVVGTVMSNKGVENYLQDHGIQMVRTSVGDRYIIEAMKSDNFTMGGEPSGHLIFHHLATTGDGMLAALQVLALLLRYRRPLSLMCAEIPLYPQKIQNIRVKQQKDLQTIEAISQEIQAVETELAGKGRVVVRYSGTEPLLRLMVEGPDEEITTRQLERLSHCIQSHI